MASATHISQTRRRSPSRRRVSVSGGSEIFLSGLSGEPAKGYAVNVETKSSRSAPRCSGSSRVWGV